MHGSSAQNQKLSSRDGVSRASVRSVLCIFADRRQILDQVLRTSGESPVIAKLDILAEG